MNGVHDLGGVDGFGKVEVEAREPVFHADWERRVFGMIAAMGATGKRLANVHAFRHAIERMDPLHYLASPYYEHWLTAIATLAVETGLVTRAELEERAGGGFAVSSPLRGAAPAMTASGATPRFAVGDEVRVRSESPLGHTRCPRYIRGKRGVIARVDPAFRVPDVAAHAEHAPRQFQYCVRFAARELWGETTGAREVVHVDLCEGYLEKE